jgi:hypothetical protein
MAFQCCTNQKVKKRRLKKIANEIVLTKEQCACILSNAFFSTFHRNLISLLPSINFDYLLHTGNDSLELKTEKLKMLMNYFTKIASQKSISIILIKSFPSAKYFLKENAYLNFLIFPNVIKIFLHRL